MERIIVNGRTYLTNLEDQLKLKKCVDFFSDGCTSYAISFNNQAKDVITKMKIDGLECYALKGFNFDYKFVPEFAKDIDNARGLLSKGLDLIELL